MNALPARGTHLSKVLENAGDLDEGQMTGQACE